MLENNIVRWGDITHTLTATAHLSHDFFRPLIAAITETLRRVPSTRLDNIDADSLGKEAINSLLGFWGKPRQTIQV